MSLKKNGEKMIQTFCTHVSESKQAWNWSMFELPWGKLHAHAP
jgi:hypothetical protein